MLDDFGKNSIEWEQKVSLPGNYSMERENENPLPGNYSIERENESPLPENCDDNMEKMQHESAIVITDIPTLAENLKAQSVCCIGYQSGKGYFPGTDLVLSSWDGLDAAFFEGIYHRFCGKPVILCETERLIIRESQKEDFDQLYHMSLECGDSVFAEKLPEDYREAKEQFEAYIKWQYSFYGFGLWTVVEKATGEIIGRCGLMPASGEAESDFGMEVGYLISFDKRCRGFAQEAVTAILDYAFEKLECPEVVAVIDEKNAASKNLAEKLGFCRYAFRRCIDKEEHKVEIWKKKALVPL